MSVLPGAFPDNVSSGVKALLEEHFQLSNAASSHNDDTAGMLLSLSVISPNAVSLLTEFLDEQKFANLFTSDGTYEMAEMQSVGHKGTLFFLEIFVL